jgi:hypothetical protein
MRRSKYSCLAIALFVVLETTVPSFARTAAPKQPPKAAGGAATAKPTPTRARAGGLTNDSVGRWSPAWMKRS